MKVFFLEDTNIQVRLFRLLQRESIIIVIEFIQNTEKAKLQSSFRMLLKSPPPFSPYYAPIIRTICERDGELKRGVRSIQHATNIQQT